jgi:hypothetical protein
VTTILAGSAYVAFLWVPIYMGAQRKLLGRFQSRPHQWVKLVPPTADGIIGEKVGDTSRAVTRRFPFMTN